MEVGFKKNLHEFVQLALAEDVKDGDHTSLSTIKLGQKGEAKLLVKEAGILAGMAVTEEIFYCIDANLQVDVRIADGSLVAVGDIALYVSGSIHSILIAERLVLNVLQRMSGIATSTSAYVQALVGTHTQVLDTRKTSPLLRFLEKEAVRIGGGANHRFGLYDMILIKDNHVDYAGGIAAALQGAVAYKKANNLAIPIEIEVRNLAELNEVLEQEKVDRVMLDNFTPAQVATAVQLIDGRLITEASGGITLETIRAYADAGVDFISVGALTHSVKCLDLSLKAKLI